jgi:transcriptional regulator with XRE-family HTH domain
MDLKGRVGARIKLLRERRSSTQAGLAEQIGVTTDAISQFERGVSAPSFGTLERLAQAFGVPVQALFDEDSADASPNRVKALAEIMDIARSLPDPDLDVARQQLEALKGRRRL